MLRCTTGQQLLGKHRAVCLLACYSQLHPFMMVSAVSNSLLSGNNNHTLSPRRREQQIAANPGSVASEKPFLKGSRKIQASFFAGWVMYALSLAGNTQSSSALHCCRITSCTAHYLQDKLIQTRVHTSTAAETATLMGDEVDAAGAQTDAVELAC